MKGTYDAKSLTRGIDDLHRSCLQLMAHLIRFRRVDLCASLASSLLITHLIVLIILIIVVNQVGLLLPPVGVGASH